MEENLETKCEAVLAPSKDQKLPVEEVEPFNRYDLGTFAYSVGLLGSGFYQGYVGERFFPEPGTEPTNADIFALISASVPFAMTAADSLNVEPKYARNGILSKVAFSPFYSVAVCAIGYGLGKWYKSRS